MKNAFFCQTQQISDHGIIFDQFQKQTIFFSYFQVDQKYYLFFYTKKLIEIGFIYQAVNVIQELDSKKRKIRSLRGFLLYVLEIMENGKDFEILSTNLQPFFWKKVKNVIRQNKKGALQEFLFGSQLNQSINHSDSQNDLAACAISMAAVRALYTEPAVVAPISKNYDIFSRRALELPATQVAFCQTFNFVEFERSRIRNRFFI